MRVENVCPPIPERQFDWVAYDDDACGCPECHPIVGGGATELEAILDYLEQVMEATRPAAPRRTVGSLRANGGQVKRNGAGRADRGG